MSATFHILRRLKRDIVTNVQRWERIRHSYNIVMKLEFSRHIFEKHSNIKFHENPSSASGVVPLGRTDRYDKANSRFSQFCERA